MTVTAEFTLSLSTEFTHTQPVYVAQTATFTNSSVGSIPFTSIWNFGNDKPLSSAGTLLISVTHTYAATGTYTVVLTAVNAYGEDVFSDTLTVLPVYPVYLPIVLK